MNFKLKTFSLVAGVWLCTLSAVFASAQAKPRVSVGAKPVSRPSINDTASFLPASDAIVMVDVNRVLNDALPLFFAADPTGLANVDTELQKFKTETGIDPRNFDQFAVGMKIQSPRDGVTTSDTVAIAHGAFQAGAIVAAGALAAAGKYEVEKYQGSTIYIFNLNENVKLLGLISTRISKLAVVVLEKNTLALGDLQMVKATLDVKRGAQSNSTLIGLATRTPDAFLGFGGNVPANVAENVDFPSDQIAKNIKSIRQVYGSATVSGKQLNMFASAKTNSPDDAASLSDTLAGLKQLGAILIAQMKVDQRKLAQNAMDNLKIDQAGNEVQLRLSIPQSDLATLMKTVGKKKA